MAMSKSLSSEHRHTDGPPVIVTIHHISFDCGRWIDIENAFEIHSERNPGNSKTVLTTVIVVRLACDCRTAERPAEEQRRDDQPNVMQRAAVHNFFCRADPAAHFSGY